jgi:two-component system chemotaxis response regulator CheY
LSQADPMPASFAELAKATLRAELQDKVTELEGLLLSLENGQRGGQPPIEIIHLTLRHTHSLKGTLGMAGRVLAGQAVHAMESVFVAVRAGHQPLTRTLFDFAFATVDRLARMVRDDQEDAAALEALILQWRTLAPVDGNAPPKPLVGLPFPLTPSEERALAEALHGEANLYLVEKTVLSDCAREEFEALPVLSEIANLGRLIARRPSFETLDRSRREGVALLLVATPLSLEALLERICDPLRPVALGEDERTVRLAKPAGKRGLKCLVVEDDFTSRLLLQKLLAPYGDAHVAVDGEEALVAIQLALEAGEPYDVICLDIMMPRLDGQSALKGLRQREEAFGFPIGTGAKVLMTTALKDHRNVMEAFREQADAYLVKPVDRQKLVQHLGRLGVLPP